MNSQIDTLMDLDGQLVIASVYDYSDQPKRCTNFYPTGIRTVDFKHNYAIDIPHEVRYLIDGKWELRWGSGFYATPLVIRLPEGGATKCIKQTVEDRPCPKVRKGIETRWSTTRGRWEKYLKSEGWVIA